MPTPIIDMYLSLYTALKGEGFELPEECRDVTVLFPVGDSMPSITFVCNLRGERLEQVGRALARLGKADR